MQPARLPTDDPGHAVLRRVPVPRILQYQVTQDDDVFAEYVDRAKAAPRKATNMCFSRCLFARQAAYATQECLGDVDSGHLSRLVGQTAVMIISTSKDAIWSTGYMSLYSLRLVGYAVVVMYVVQHPRAASFALSKSPRFLKLMWA